MKKARAERQPLDLDLPERKLLLEPDGTLDRVVVPPRLEAHRLIEEFMILANVCAAETLERAHIPLLYRVHGEPSAEKLEGLREVLASIGIKLPKQGAMRPGLFNAILKRVEGTPHQAFINEVVLRTQAQAEYAPENYGHFGLNLRRYAHFTSPIRRYADLIVHRGLIGALRLGKDGLSPSVTVAALAEIGARISAAERRAMAAERDTIDRLIAAHLADEIGAVFRRAHQRRHARRPLRVARRPAPRASFRRQRSVASISASSRPSTPWSASEAARAFASAISSACVSSRRRRSRGLCASRCFQTARPRATGGTRRQPRAGAHGVRRKGEWGARHAPASRRLALSLLLLFLTIPRFRRSN